MSGRSSRPNVDNTYRHGIICRKCVVKNTVKAMQHVLTVNIGTLVEIHKSKKEDIFFYIVNTSMQDDRDLFLCKRGDILLVPENLWGPLLTVKEEDRLSIVKDAELAESLGNIQVGNTVKILGKDFKDVCTGSVTFKNSLAKLGVGVYFGLRITNPKDDITYIVKNISLLQPGTKGFPRGCDIVVSIDKIRPVKSRSRNLQREQQKVQAESNKNKNYFDNLVSQLADYKDKKKNDIETYKYKSGLFEFTTNHDNGSNEKKVPEFPLSIGEKVVSIDEGEPEIGTVKWFGYINDQIIVGVEFDNPVGSGTGTVNGVELFKAKPQHASLIPIEALIKLSDYEMDWTKDCSNQQKNTNNNISNNLSLNHEVAYNQCFSRRQDLEESRMSKIISLNQDLLYQSSSLHVREIYPGKNCNQERFEKELGYNGNSRQTKSMDNNLAQSKELLINLPKSYASSPKSPGKEYEDVFSNNQAEQCDLICESDFSFGTSDINSSLFVEPSEYSYSVNKMNAPNNAFGQFGCSVVEGTVPPIKEEGNLEAICGKNRGIQGHHNSCYLDATLFAMFAFTSVFDSLLYRPPTVSDIPQYREVQRVLKEEIVNPLRKNLYVGANQVMKLRTLLEKLSSVSGLTCDEKDPEEFLNSLLAQILKAEPFLKLSSGQEAFHYQLFVEKDERLTCPSVQQLFEQSFFTSDIKLKEVPSCLIIQMPRFGKSFKMYSKIFPPQSLDVTDIIENSPRICTICGKLAEFECKDCFGQDGIGSGLESTSFCARCLGTAHNHHRRAKHNSRPIKISCEFSDYQDVTLIQRIQMELFAVVCIKTSHYVAFVKCGTTPDAPWCFFDSMADREGEQNGYNIPEMVPCPDLPFWLSEEGAKRLIKEDERQLPEHAKRLFCDAYMCMYQSPEIMMYR